MRRERVGELDVRASGDEANSSACSSIRGTVVLPEGGEQRRVQIQHQGVSIRQYLGDTDAFELVGVLEGTWPVAFTWKIDGRTIEQVLEARPGDVLRFDPAEAR